ncbi:VCBS repeat-containing protein [uncultured Kocuria sp.]|uniref:FG-GAP repeat domain-containing protein n=1 Tax=uncultured Kocuria sp. TaxID=259305 RepID=UPI0026124369|nr:VCBS repeat-containing protein [uncultured Kocuria sp.]
MAHSSTSRLVTGTAAAALAVTGIAVAGPAHAAAQQYFTYANEWRVDEHVRELADVNGDGRADVVGFGDPGTFVAYGRTDGTFAAPVLAIRDYGTAQRWAWEQAQRTTGDVNGDGRADLIGFGTKGVQVSYARPDGSFTPAAQVVDDFGWAQRWTVERHPRHVADVNGDGIEDIVGFGDAGVRVAYGRANSTFAPAALKIPDFGVSQGWRTDQHPRQLADVNDDGAADVVGFGYGGTWISYGRTGSTFTQPGLEVRDFGTAQGWRVDQHPRAVGDITGDGRADIVGFGHRGIHVARSIPTLPRNINFYPTALEVADFGAAQGWQVDRHPRLLADITGDGVEDVVGFGNAGTWVSDGNPAPLTGPRLLTPEFGYNTGWTPQKYPRLLGDVNGDGRDDIVAFGHSQLSVRPS